MKSLYLLLLTLLLCVEVSHAQTYNGNGQVSFSAGAPLDLIKGTSSEIIGSIDLKSGKLQFEIPVKSFQFPNSLMQERFNDKYMESNRYARATFNGKLLNYTLGKTKEVTAQGVLTIHGVSKRRTIKGTLVEKGNKLILQSAFIVSTKDHHIESPKLTNAYMAESIDVRLEMHLLPTDPAVGAVTLNQKRRTK
ncbi:YceI family protein [Pontibacter locisalis]|uniref:YceI family protein n=1 Tax=Pontibacter locisalis TaxID=1719035 RepID=A0ABW5ITR4_9BACT